MNVKPLIQAGKWAWSHKKEIIATAGTVKAVWDTLKEIHRDFKDDGKRNHSNVK